MLGSLYYCEQADCIQNPASALAANQLLYMSIAGSRQSAAAAGAQSAICDPGKQSLPSCSARQHCVWQRAFCNAHECKHPCMAASPSPHAGGLYKRDTGDLRQPLFISEVPPPCLGH